MALKEPDWKFAVLPLYVGGCFLRTRHLPNVASPRDFEVRGPSWFNTPRTGGERPCVLGRSELLDDDYVRRWYNNVRWASKIAADHYDERFLTLDDPFIIADFDYERGEGLVFHSGWRSGRAIKTPYT
jgi:hypothetical protein